MPEMKTDGLILLRTSLDDVFQGDMLTAIKRHIACGQVVIIKGAVDEKKALALRDLVCAWRCGRDVVAFSVNTNIPGINFHRMDADPARSRLPHRFHQHGFGAPRELGSDLQDALFNVALPMLRLQNAVAGTDYSLDMPDIRIKVLQYPQGGGFLENHAHPLEPQRVGLILGLSKAGEDYVTGGTTFLTPMGDVDTSHDHDAGDLILFRYDLEHSVTPVDENAELDWTKPGGRWSLVLELITTHARSEAT